jgi:hypothetical protein
MYIRMGSNQWCIIINRDRELSVSIYISAEISVSNSVSVDHELLK